MNVVLFSIFAIALSGVESPHFRGFTVTFRHITIGRTLLEEQSVRRRDLYLITHNTQKHDLLWNFGIESGGHCVEGLFAVKSSKNLIKL